MLFLGANVKRWYQMLRWWISSPLWRPPQNRGERVFLQLLQ